MKALCNWLAGGWTVGPGWGVFWLRSLGGSCEPREFYYVQYFTGYHGQGKGNSCGVVVEVWKDGGGSKTLQDVLTDLYEQTNFMIQSQNPEISHWPVKCPSNM